MYMLIITLSLIVRVPVVANTYILRMSLARGASISFTDLRVFR